MDQAIEYGNVAGYAVHFLSKKRGWVFIIGMFLKWKLPKEIVKDCIGGLSRRQIINQANKIKEYLES